MVTSKEVAVLTGTLADANWTVTVGFKACAKAPALAEKASDHAVACHFA